MGLFLPRGRKVHFVIKDHYLRFVENDKKNRFLSFRQKCLPKGIVIDGQIKNRDIFAMILEEIVQEENLKGRPLSFCIPDSFVIVRKTTIPKEIKEDEMNGYLYLQLGETIHLPFDDPIIESVFLEEKEEEKEVLVIATKESIVKDFVELFDENSLKPTVADLSILSLYRFYYHLGEAEKDDHLLLIYIGVDTLQLSAFYEHKPEVVRHIKLPLNEDQLEVVRSRSGNEVYQLKDMTDGTEGLEREIITEIERFLNFYQFSLMKGEHQITKIVLTGDHPNLAQLELALKGNFNLPFQSLLKPFFSTNKGAAIPPVFNDCIGLALK